MQSSQRTYIRERIGKIAAEKIDAFAETQPKTKTLSNSEKLAMIRDGRAKLRKHIYLHTELSEAFEFESPEIEKQHKANVAKFDAFRAKVMERVQRVTDQIMLGDAEGAVQAIAEFEKWKP